MLVLSRKPGQGIHVGEDVTVTVLSVKGNRVRLGIAAPDSYRILRAELDDWSEEATDELRLAAVGSL